jgi:transcriptional regulator with XRE-family HTH domain
VTPAAIFALRKRLGLTQEAFAVLLGLAPRRSVICSIEAGYRPITKPVQVLLTYLRSEGPQGKNFLKIRKILFSGVDTYGNNH